MKLQKQTLSYCPTCYAEIPAKVKVLQEGVFLEKQCPTHGSFESMIERDSNFYLYANSLPNPGIYGGYFVDVTRRCNLRCQYCYHPKSDTEPADEFSIARIVADCKAQAALPGRLPIILTGGEPTLRPDIVELVNEVSRIGPVQVLTNGVRLAQDDDLFNRLMPALTRQTQIGNVANLNLSIHHKETDKWRDVVFDCNRKAVCLESALIVIDSEQSFLDAIAIAREVSSAALGVRLKAATRSWNEQKPNNRIYVSDMMNWLEKHVGSVEIVTNGVNNNSRYLNVRCDGLYLMLVAWPDIHNFDLCEVHCPPYYRAKNGEVRNLVEAFAINEGMDKGWCKGRRLG